VSNDSKFAGVLERALAAFREWSSDPLAYLESGKSFGDEVKPLLDKVGRWFTHRKEGDSLDDLEAYIEILTGGGSVDLDDREMKLKVDVKDDDGNVVMIPSIDEITGEQKIAGIDPATVKRDADGNVTDPGKPLLATEPKTEMITVAAWTYMQEHFKDDVGRAVADIIELMETAKEMCTP
jgi:hypothetical protein